MGLSSEIFLATKQISEEKWLKFIKAISNYQGIFRKWCLTINIDKGEISYQIKTKYYPPSTIHNLTEFILKQSKNCKDIVGKHSKAILFAPKNLIDIIEYFEIKKNLKLRFIEIYFRKINKETILSSIYFYLEKNNVILKKRLFFHSSISLLSSDLKQNERYFYKSVPKYLDISKILHLLQSDSCSSLFKIDTFPYLQGDFYLKQNSYHFNKHSLILGSSGAGKSKFISLFVHNLYKQKELENYKIIIIDPHAALENDIGGIGKVIDFKNNKNSIDLFNNDTEDIISSTELLLELLKSLMIDQYNSKLERVLRHSIHLLLLKKDFQFKSLRKLLLDTEYRSTVIEEQVQNLPESVRDFFLTDFNDLKTKSYGEAISPIISFIDEMEMIPVFHNKTNLDSLKDTIHNNFLTIFSLDKIKLGDKSAKTIAGLIMEQLLMLIQSYEYKEHIIFIIDEVAVVENPILSRYLSEARKYNLSLMLSSQYFHQISENLKNSIFANTINYYLFRVSRTDATLLASHLPMKIPLEDTLENKIKLLTELNNRECLVRIDSNDILLPSFRAKTLDFKSIPRIKETEEKEIDENTQITNKSFSFSTDNVNLEEILITHSSKKGGINHE